MTAPETTRLQCTGCGRPAEGGRFCTTCGAALQAAGPLDAWTLTGRPAAAPSQPSAPEHAAAPAAAPSDEPPFWAPAGTTPPPWQGAEPAAPVRRGRSNVLALLVVGALVVSGWALLRGVEQHTLTGTVALVDADQLGLEPGDECFGEGGYDDLNAGAQVVVTDEEGTTLSTGRLSSGEFDGLGCVFSFTLEDVTRAEFYGLSVADEDRGELQYSYDELADDDWSVELSLGDD